MVLHGRPRQLDETVWPIEPHTTLKHLAYRVYLQCWMAKILTKFEYATIVDAFSGPGVYMAGQPGSPVVAARAFLEHKNLARFGRLRILCCEEREDRLARLRQEIQKLPDSRALEVVLLTPGSFDERIEEVGLRSHSPKSAYPVLWILDPFNIKSVSMSHLKKCLAGLRDEVVLTFFVDEMYRFAEKNPNMAPALTRQYGNDSWHRALSKTGELAQKQAFTSLFCSVLEESAEVLTRSFGVCAKNSTSRYELVFATHSDKGLEWPSVSYVPSRCEYSLAEWMYRSNSLTE